MIVYQAHSFESYDQTGWVILTIAFAMVHYLHHTLIEQTMIPDVEDSLTHQRVMERFTWSLILFAMGIVYLVVYGRSTFYSDSCCHGASGFLLSAPHMATTCTNQHLTVNTTAKRESNLALFLLLSQASLLLTCSISGFD